jgi:hypothetical protein
MKGWEDCYLLGGFSRRDLQECRREWTGIGHSSPLLFNIRFYLNEFKMSGKRQMENGFLHEKCGKKKMSSVFWLKIE